MNGQWTGEFTGTNGGGKLIVDVDDCGSYFRGVAYSTSNIQGTPQIAIGFQTPDNGRKFHIVTENITLYDPLNGEPTSWDSIKDRFEGLTAVKAFDVKGEWDEISLRLSWTTDIGTSGDSTLPKSRSDQPSSLKAQRMNWADFKQHVSGLGGRRDLFRGQSDPWRLRTTFHRSGRADLSRYINEDIRSLHRHLSFRTRHKFDLKDPDENGAFFNLLQHHGYPTPLLDWSYSPYVAAFFAYRGISRAESRAADPNRCVRIFILDERWRNEVPQVLMATRPYQNFSVAEFIAIENERMIPQQSVSAVTNVDDIESYLDHMAHQIGKGKLYLSAIDLPWSQRSTVVDDLTHMGVTAGSLFPGLDGACEELKERHFR